MLEPLENRLVPASISADHGTVTVNEGQTATNTGTWTDAALVFFGGTFAISTDLGSMTGATAPGSLLGNGTWSWQAGTGSAGTSTVHINLRDNINDPSGSVNTAGTSFQLVVNHLAPTMSISGANTADEGATYTLSLGAITDFDAVTAVRVHWGDGTADTVVSGGSRNVTHVFTNPNTQPTVSVDVTDTIGTFTNVASKTITVNLVRPSIDLSGADTVNEGFPYTLTLGNQKGFGVTQIAVNWGDGQNDNYAFGQPSATHTYADGTIVRGITVSITDKDGTFVVGSKVITVEDVAPTIDLTGNATAVVGVPYTLNLGAVTDPGVNDVVTAYTIHWGDGSSQFFSVSPAGQSRTHTYASAAARTVTVDLVNNDGIFLAAGTLAVNVLAAPTIDVSGADSIDEGSPYALSLGPIHNAPAGGITQISIDWGDGSPAETFGPAQTVADHVFPNGPLAATIVVSLVDADGTFAGGKKTVTVNDVPPTIVLTGADTVTAGQPYTLTLGAITDPGILDVVSEYSVNWGDGSSNLFVGNPTGKTAMHTYPAGSFIHTITVDLVDQDGTHAAAGSKIVRLLTLSGPSTVVEWATYTLTLSPALVAVDPLARWTVNWGDGTTLTLAGTATNATHVYADEGSYTISATATASPADGNVSFAASNTIAVTATDNPNFIRATKTATVLHKNGQPPGGPASPGDTIHYVVTITNIGLDTATNVTLADTPDVNTALTAGSVNISPLAPGETFSIAGTALNASFGSLAPGASIAIAFDALVRSPIKPGLTSVSNQSTIHATDPGTSAPFVAFVTTDPATGKSNAPTVTPLAKIVDLKVTATFKPNLQVAPGGTIVYTLNYTNLGNTTATGVMLTMLLPAGTTFNAAASTAGWFTTGGGLYHLRLGSVAGGASGSVKFGATVPVKAHTPGSISTTATIADNGVNGLDFDPLDNTTGVIKTAVDTTNSRRWR